MNIRERVDAAELRLEDAKSWASEADATKQSAWRELFAAFNIGDYDSDEASRAYDAHRAAINAEYVAVEECLALEEELVELKRVLATGTDPHAAIMEGAL